MMDEHEVAWNLFVELRKEVLESQKLRTQFVGFKITVVSAGIGLIAAHTGKIPNELYVLPAFAAILFDLIIASYSFSIKRIGHYCASVLEPHIKGERLWPANFPLWEEALRRPEYRQQIANTGTLGITMLATIPAGIVVVAQLPSPLAVSSLSALTILLAYDIKAILFARKFESAIKTKPQHNLPSSLDR